MCSQWMAGIFPLVWMVVSATVAFGAPPAVPLGLAMTSNSPNSVALSWYRPAADDVTGYNLYASDKADGTFTKVATVTERTATQSGLAPGVSMFYKLAATNADGESAMTKPVSAFTIAKWEPAAFPVRVAKNMCVSLDAAIVSTPAPKAGKLASLVDGSDATGCTIEGACEVKIKLNETLSIADADYLILNFRTDNAGKDYAYNINWRSLKKYVIIESDDSTNGNDGTWKEVLSGTNEFLDGVVVIPNHKPKWIGVRNNGALQLCRLDIFRSAPAGFRNDYWIFTGDSLIVQDMAGGAPDRHTVWFSDLVRKHYPDRYPIVVQAAQGGEMLDNTFGRMKKTLPDLSPPNGTPNATATIVCWEAGFNDVGVGGGLWMGDKIIKKLSDAQELCTKSGLLIVPVRIEYSTGYLDKTMREPAKYNIFYNTLPVNLAGVDVFCRRFAPYACDPETNLPYADYWNYTRTHYETALGKDGVHHTKAGSDGINTLWAEIAGKMVYAEHADKSHNSAATRPSAESSN